MEKYIYRFEEGDTSMYDLLGRKGANLSELYNLGLPVPKGFIITTQACAKYYRNGQRIPEDMKEQILDAVKALRSPFIVSVRSSAPASMPGMMDTILNLGLNDGTISVFQDKKFAYECYSQFIQSYSCIAEDMPKTVFETDRSLLEIDMDTSSIKGLKALTDKFKALYERFRDSEFPQDPETQLLNAVEAVFRSWNNKRAVIYRKFNDIPDVAGTAVVIQEMVFGNYNGNSSTGVIFTKDPSTGEKAITGEYLPCTQGEGIVSGTRTPEPIENFSTKHPKLFHQLKEIGDRLEAHFRNVQEIEFTVQDNELFILQTRGAKLTPQASVRIACNMAEEELISHKEAVSRIDQKMVARHARPVFDPDVIKATEPLTQGLPASPGCVSGIICFTEESMKNFPDISTILVRRETSTEDVKGMSMAGGILTAKGGMSSHASVVAREMDKPCITGCGDLFIDEEAHTLTINGRIFYEGDYLSMSGSTGRIYEGYIPTVKGPMNKYLGQILKWKEETEHENNDYDRHTV